MAYVRNAGNPPKTEGPVDIKLRDGRLISGIVSSQCDWVLIGSQSDILFWKVSDAEPV